MANGNGAKTRNPEEIRAEIARARAEIASSVIALKEQVDATTDWKLWFNQQPWAFVGAAFAVGLFVGWKPKPRTITLNLDD